MAKICQNCGAAMADNMNFCPNCHAKAVQSEPPVPAETSENKGTAGAGGMNSEEKRSGAKKSWPLWIIYIVTVIAVLFSITIFIGLELFDFGFGPFKSPYGWSNFSLQLTGLAPALLLLILLPFFSWKGRIIGIIGAVASCGLIGSTFFWKSDEYVRRDISIKCHCRVRLEGRLFYLSDAYVSYDVKSDPVVLIMRRQFASTNISDFEPGNTAAELYLYWHKKTGKDLHAFFEGYEEARRKSAVSWYYGNDAEEECRKNVISRFCDGIGDGDWFAVWCCLLPKDRENPDLWSVLGGSHGGSKVWFDSLRPVKVSEEWAAERFQRFLIKRDGFYYISGEALGDKILCYD